MSTSVISRAITADTSFDYNVNRQYLMIVVEGTATLTFDGGDTVNLTGYYEPLVVPRNGFTIHNISGKVVIVSDAVTMRNSTLPIQRLIPKFNGTNQYAITSNIDMVAGDVLYFDIIAPTSLSTSIRMLVFDSVTLQNRVRVNADGVIELRNGTLKIDGVAATSVPLDGLKHSCAFTATQTTRANLFAAQTNGSTLSNFCDFPIFNVKLNNGAIHNYIMNDGFTTNPEMRNSGSGGNGQYVGFTANTWIQANL